MASRSRWVRRTFSGIGACEDGRVMVRLLCRGCGLQTAHCKPADQHRQLASAIGWQLPPGHLLARLARAHDEPRSSARAPVAPRCRAAAASSTGMTLQGFRWGWLELAFKRLKSLVGLKEPPAKDPRLAKAHVLAHLLIALLIEPRVEVLEVSPPRAPAARGRWCGAPHD